MITKVICKISDKRTKVSKSKLISGLFNGVLLTAEVILYETILKIIMNEE